eukprot:UC1_evm3s1615
MGLCQSGYVGTYGTTAYGYGGVFDNAGMIGPTSTTVQRDMFGDTRVVQRDMFGDTREIDTDMFGNVTEIDRSAFGGVMVTQQRSPYIGVGSATLYY